jgi:hypothetical protein
MTSSGIVAMDESGKEQWHYVFSQEDQHFLTMQSRVRVLAGSNPGVLAATSNRKGVGDGSIRGGQLLWLTPNGTLSRTFMFDDSVSFGGVKYGDPWMIDDFGVDERSGRRRIAVAAHHEIWWPSVVTVLDEQWQRTGTFVNAGFVSQVHWLSPDRLLISGYANAYDGGMVAVLDPRTFDGQSPDNGDSKYQCSTCGSGSPLRYVVIPRSEVNRASGSPLNGAVVQMQDGGILVRTIEVPRIAQAVEALYEFSPSLELLSASFGDRYWEAHRELEAEGKIHHSRERCPYRDGPQGMTVWETTSGWQPLAPRAGPK